MDEHRKARNQRVRHHRAALVFAVSVLFNAELISHVSLRETRR